MGTVLEKYGSRSSQPLSPLLEQKSTQLTTKDVYRISQPMPVEERKAPSQNHIGKTKINAWNVVRTKQHMGSR